ncbi:hypothetical protein [Natronorubrum halophilum]|uniref:hypothetical protein n=1 Tax=Natronorubrum halophilum TaxID=1702106 RepID=UPI0013CF3489|nr:hypothetical protein [Natronorubrum halophilum]
MTNQTPMDRATDRLPRPPRGRTRPETNRHPDRATVRAERAADATARPATGIAAGETR